VNEKLLKKLEELEARSIELEKRLADPEVMSNRAAYARYMRELGGISKVVAKFRERRKLLAEKEEAESLAADPSCDAELRSLARDDIAELARKLARCEEALLEMLLSDEAETHDNLIMEIRAGTGGEEAALFAADLLRMYLKYAESAGWKCELLHSNTTGLGGVKEAILGIQGRGAYGRLKYESGVHRVQRVPTTEASGRIHTSAVTVAVLPEAEEVDVQIDPADLRIDTFRASGPGGQKVNKTSSAVRITHIPSGLVVQCQDEKSQHKNKARAMRILRSRLYQLIESQKQTERDQLRRLQVRSGDRSEKIRTYNFPDNRVTDHRIGFTLHELRNVMLGRLDPILDALSAHARESRLEKLGAAKSS